MSIKTKNAIKAMIINIPAAPILLELVRLSLADTSFRLVLLVFNLSTVISFNNSSNSKLSASSVTLLDLLHMN
jgi:hypothetical protein